MRQKEFEIWDRSAQEQRSSLCCLLSEPHNCNERRDANGSENKASNAESASGNRNKEKRTNSYKKYKMNLEGRIHKENEQIQGSKRSKEHHTNSQKAQITY